jgi:polysaccharide biosynthesis/export protein
VDAHVRVYAALRVAILLAVSLAQPWSPGALAVESSYRIGAGDVLSISVWDNKDLDQVVFVRPDGRISLPLIGEVPAAGVTVDELATRLGLLYAKTIKGAQVSVDVKEIRSRPVFFVGGVGKTGPLQLTQDLTLLQGISLAGGLAPGADLESAFVLRSDKVIPVDFVKLIQKADLSQNVKLQPGDTVVVPVADVVYVEGEVKAPGPVKFTKELTMLKAIAQTGGFTNLANPKRVSILRGQGSKKQTVEVNVRDMMKDEKAAPDMALKPNDIVIVPQRLF